MLRPPYPIETERLLLRPYVPEDFEAFFDLFGREDVWRYLPFGRVDEEVARGLHERRVARTTIEEEGGSVILAAIRREDPARRPIGEFMLRYTSERHLQGEVGWVVHPDQQRRGYAVEAAARMIRLGFEELGLHRIAAECDPRNDASIAVMERLGMRREAHLVESELIAGEWVDAMIYAILDREWAARPSA